MRLINADLMFKCETCRHHRNGGCNTYCDHGEEYSPNMSKLPTIDPEDLRPKGEWIRPTKINGRSFNIPHCSACEGVPCGVDENTRYCPYCGANNGGK